jgi:integrase-like protein
VHAELRLGRGIHVSRKRVERLIREAAISGLIRRRRPGTTIRVPGVRVADDLVQRGFRPAAPNVLWCADITYLQTWQGRCYLAAVQDLFSRTIVGWQLAEHMRAESVHRTGLQPCPSGRAWPPGWRAAPGGRAASGRQRRAGVGLVLVPGEPDAQAPFRSARSAKPLPNPQLASLLPATPAACFSTGADSSFAGAEQTEVVGRSCR